ncbi:MAG: ABC transporter ATP-binding protein [Desulfobulbaceae bacterium A2]|nr:MAG: ABC transporter ATP-binding protein [Desulfobulbaceae bacterium A2]
MLSINGLSLQYGKKHLFLNLQLQVHADDRIGLVGVNGAGKSTLMKIMAGLQEIDPGVLQRARWFSVAYLPQEVAALGGGKSLVEEARTAFADVLALQAELEEVTDALVQLAPDDEDIPGLLRRQGSLQHELEGRDVFLLETQVRKILAGLGFRETDLERPVEEFSGGWLMRLHLAKLLLQHPSLLLLDEPTNHLDLDSLTWLENFLEDYDGALLLISHDRAFLDRVTRRTWELSQGRLAIYQGNYSRYLTEKVQRLAVEDAAYANQQARIRQTERFIERFRAKSTKAKQVQSRVRQLEKMERIERSVAEKQIGFTFPPALSCSRHVLLVEGLGKDFGRVPVFDGVEFSLRRGEKLAVVGVNGAGKTTLLRILAGVSSAERGQLRLGHGVQRSYFGQHQAQELPQDFTVLGAVAAAAEEQTTTQIRSLLGALLFSGEEVEKKVAVLSGGEKSRVALARMLVRPANLMLLDEPTNHLDMASQEILQEALADYEGSIVVVSHNRWFLRGFINRVLELREGKATLYEGGVDEYLARRAQGAAEGTSPAAVPAAGRGGEVLDADAGATTADRKEQRRQRAVAREELNRRLKPLRETVRTSERAIEDAELRKKELEERMSDPQLYGDQIRWAEVSQEYAVLGRRLERLYVQWEEAQTELGSIEAEEKNAV